MMEGSTNIGVLALLLWGFVGFAAVLQSLSGFGFALLVMPILTLLLGIRTSAPLVALLGLTLYVMNTARWRGHVRWPELRRLLLGSFLGIPLGMIVLVALPESVVTAGLGALILGYVLFTLRQPEMSISLPPWAIYLIGFLGGSLGGAYNTYGPPVIVYAHSQRWPKADFRATLQSFFLFSALLVVVGHIVTGHITTTVMRLYALSLPALLLGTYSAFRLDARVGARTFQYLVTGLLTVLSLSLMAKGIVGT